MKKIEKLIQWFCVKSGFRFWYQITYSYKVNGKEIFNFNRHVGVAMRSDILNHRQICGIFPLHKVKGTKGHLKNGELYYHIDCYIGFIIR